MQPMPRVVLDVTEEELMHMSRDQVTMHITEREIAFCQYFAANHNVKMSAIKAGYAPGSASVVGWRVRKKEDVNRYICWLKVKTARDVHVSALDILDQWIKIAFSDITDYYDLDTRGRIVPKRTELIDGQVVSKIRVNREGVLIELHDKLRALEKLESYFDVIPSTWQEKVADRKMQLMEEKFGLDKQKYEDEKDWEEEQGTDPLVDAMGKSTMDDIWDEDDEEDDWDEE